MVANFGDSIIDGEIKPSVEQQAPVVDNSGLYLAEAASSALQGVGSIFGGMVKKGQEDAANGVLNSYRQEATLIADGVDQNRLTVPAARGRLRKLYSEAIANNPSLGADIDKLHSSLMDQYGIGSVIKSGNEQTQRDLKEEDAANAAGWVGPDNKPDVGGYQNWQRAVTNSETITRDISRRTAQRGEVSAIDQDRLKSTINDMAIAGLPWVDQQIETAAKLLDGGADPVEVVAKLRADVGGVVGEFTTNAGGLSVEHIVGPIEKRLKIFEDLATGAITTEIMTAKSANIKAVGEYALRSSDPELAELLTISELFQQNAGPLLEFRLKQKSTEMLANSQRKYDPASDTNSKPSDYIGQDGDIKAALDTAKTLMNNSIDVPSEKLPVEISNQITDVLRSLKSYNGESVKDYRNVIDFLADPSVQKWVESGKLVIPANVSEQAADVIQREYESVLLPIVEEQWVAINNTVQTAATNALANSGSLVGGAPTNMAVEGNATFITPVWNGTSVSFVPAPGYENNAHIKGVAKGLNVGENAIAGPLNTFIRAKAHINGSNDYTKEWEAIGPRLFGIGDYAPEKPADGSKGQEATSLAQPLGYAAVPPLNEAIAAIESADLGDFNDNMVATYIDASAGEEDVAPDIADGEEALKAFEGFSSKPYWDVNAYRVGFGSDTITKEDGTVVKVKPGMSVTRADAQRDLTRRLNKEFIPGIVKLVGEDAWAPLPPAAKTALASIAYNYGSLGPDGANIARVVATGDLEAIAAAVERLKKHNGGVNSKRRQAEANMIRKSNG